MDQAGGRPTGLGQVVGGASGERTAQRFNRENVPRPAESRRSSQAFAMTETPDSYAARQRWRGILGALVMFWLAGPGSAAPQAPRSEVVSFHNGDVRLSGTLYLPVGRARHPGVVLFHAAGGGARDFHAYRHLTTALPAAGFAVLLFDRRDSGASAGDFNAATFQDLAKDGIAAVAFLKAREDIEPGCVGVWGVSQGGWLAPLAATLSDDIAFVVAVSAPGVSPAAQMDYAAARALRDIDQPPSVVERALHVRARGKRLLSRAGGKKPSRAGCCGN